jgi:hypothetical protein
LVLADLGLPATLAGAFDLKGHFGGELTRACPSDQAS